MRASEVNVYDFIFCIIYFLGENKLNIPDVMLYELYPKKTVERREQLSGGNPTLGVWRIAQKTTWNDKMSASGSQWCNLNKRNPACYFNNEKNNVQWSMKHCRVIKKLWCPSCRVITILDAGGFGRKAMVGEYILIRPNGFHLATDSPHAWRVRPGEKTPPWRNAWCPRLFTQQFL